MLLLLMTCFVLTLPFVRLNLLDGSDRPDDFVPQDFMWRYMYRESLPDGSKKLTVYNTETSNRLVLCVRPDAHVAISFNPPLGATRTVPWVQHLAFLDDNGRVQVRQPSWRDDFSGVDLLDNLDAITL